jgi:anti-anti-sigma factor
MAEVCVIEDKDSYYQISDFDSETSDFRGIFAKIEDALNTKEQDFVLSLTSVKVLYSSHLAAFVRINQMLRKKNLHFVLVDISPEIRNLLQITQLDSIFSVYDSISDFKNSLKYAGKHASAGPNFEWQIVKIGENSINVICKGDMAAGDSLEELQKNIVSYSNISFDFSKLGSMDSASIALMENMVNKHSVQISGASEAVVQQLQQKSICEKIKFL